MFFCTIASMLMLFPRLLTQFKVTPCFPCCLCLKLQYRPDGFMSNFLIDHLIQCFSPRLVGSAADWP